MDSKTLEVTQGLVGVSSLATAMPAVAKYVPGGHTVSVAVDGVTSAMTPMISEAKASEELSRPLDKVNQGFKDETDYDPVAESKKGWWQKAAHGFGRSLLITGGMIGIGALVGLPVFGLGAVAGAIVGGVLSIPVNMAVSWAYDKIVPCTNCQDPVTVAANIKQLRKDGKEVPEHLVGAAMISSLPPGSFRKHIENRLYKMTGERQIKTILEKNPEAVSLVLRDPGVVAELCNQYGTVYDPQFVSRTTKMFNEGKIGARALMHTTAPDVSLAHMQEMTGQGSSVSDPLVRPDLPGATGQSRGRI